MKKIAALCVLGVLSTSAFAETKKETPVQKTNKIEEKKDLDKYKRVVLDESMANREGKNYTLNAAITGLSFGAASAGIEFGYFFDENTVLNVQALTLESMFTEESESFYQDGKGSALNVSLKKFTGNSFYIKPGIYRRSQRVVDSATWRFSGGESNVISRDASDFVDVGISFAIGNQWQWENFTLGCDWIGLSRSLSILESSDEGDGASLAQSDLNSGQLLNFYLGYTF